MCTLLRCLREFDLLRELCGAAVLLDLFLCSRLRSLLCAFLRVFRPASMRVMRQLTRSASIVRFVICVASEMLGVAFTAMLLDRIHSWQNDAT